MRIPLVCAPSAVIAALLVTTLGQAADPVPSGPEITVSSGTTSERPRIAADAGGSFMVVWEGAGAVARARRFYANGNEAVPEFVWSAPGHFMTSGGSASYGDFAVASDAAGNFMLTWTVDDGSEPGCDDQCVYTRRNDAFGVTGSSFQIRDSADTYVYAYFEGDQISNPEITEISNGDFVVMWEGYDQYAYPSGSPGFGSGESMFARRTVPSGQTKGGAFRVNTDAAYYQGQYGEFAGDSDGAGNFVTVFDDEYHEYLSGLPGNLVVQRFNAQSKKEGAPFPASSTLGTNGYWVDLAQAPNGNFMVIWNDSGLFGRVFDGAGTALTPDFLVSASSTDQPAVAASDDAFVVAWRGADLRVQRFDLLGTAISTDVQVTADLGIDDPDIAAANNGDFVVSYRGGASYVKAQRFSATAAATQEIGVFAKSLVIGNKVPDDPAKNKVSWTSTGPEITIPLRGTTSDPQCNGDPSGTVKATVRFSSPTSGHDSGVIDLPCQNWFAFGTNKPDQIEKRIYRYVDNARVNGPCNAVLVKGTKSLKVKCKGAGFPYDLEAGTAEATVNAVLTLGEFQYCAAFPAAGTTDGSDGKKFKGKNGPIVGCPP